MIAVKKNSNEMKMNQLTNFLLSGIKERASINFLISRRNPEEKKRIQ